MKKLNLLIKEFNKAFIQSVDTRAFSVLIMLLLFTSWGIIPSELHAQIEFAESDASVAAVFNSSSDLGDYDQDGDLDLVVTGENTGSPGTTISKNSGNGSFEFLFSTGITGLYEGAAKWADFDNDDDLDLLITGKNFDDVPLTLIYENQGNDEFADMEASLIGLTESAADVADVDGDGDVDFIVSGEDENGDNHTILYLNDGSASFSASDQDFGIFDGGSAVFGDYDNDGDPDLFVNGFEGGASERDARIFKNDGEGNFTDIQAGLKGANRSDRGAAWADVDGDDDLDLIYVGQAGQFPDTFAETLYYKNEGNDTFSKVDHDIVNVQSGTVSFGDVDDDGDLDLYLSGEREETGRDAGGIYENDGSGSFEFLSTSVATGTAGSSNWLDVDGDSDLDIIVTGIDERSSTFNRVFGTVFLNMRFIAGGFRIAETDINGLAEARIAVGDYDNDGDADVASIGIGGGGIAVKANIYQNNGVGKFTNIDANLEPAENGAISWVDIDGDEDLDLFLAGRDDLNQVYATVFVNEQGGFTAGEFGVAGVDNAASAWADIDGDSDPDLALMGQDQNGDAVTKIYQNEADTLIDMESNLQGAFDGTLEFGDYDNDGDPDLLLVGNMPDPDGVIPDAVTILYRNKGDGTFEEVSASLEQLDDVGRFADYDNDNDLDILISGDRQTLLYKNEGGDSFAEVDADLPEFFDSFADWGDFDDDGDLDLILTGTDENGGRHTNLYQNDGNDSFTQINTGFSSYSEGYATWFDKDGDTDLDLMVMGGLSIDLYENTRKEPDTITDLDDQSPEQPRSISLNDNYPNPFNPSTNITFDLSEPRAVSITVFDILGRKVQTLVRNQQLQAGQHTIRFNAEKLSSGVYLYRMKAGEFSQTKKMLLVK